MNTCMYLYKCVLYVKYSHKIKSNILYLLTHTCSFLYFEKNLNILKAFAYKIKDTCHVTVEFFCFKKTGNFLFKY